MSVAAYASLLSLTQVLGQIQKYHARGRIHLDKQQIQNFRVNLQFLQEFLELYPQSQSKDMRGLAGRISNTAVEAEIVIDYHVVDQMRGAFDNEIDKGLSAFRVALQDVVQEMEWIKEELLKMVNLDSPTIHHHRPVYPVRAATYEVESSLNRSMVGSEEHMKRIIDELINHKQSLQVIPIVGMGGIGKTTLARCVYEDPRIVSRFDRRIWCTISQQFSVQQLLQDILKGLLKEEFNQESRELGEKLHKSLFSLRFLIIMDDVWSVEAWDCLKVFLPQNGKGSRVLVTTRLSSVCVSLGWNEPYRIGLLDDDKSWDLLYQKVFDQRGDCSAELIEIGKRIAKSCGGLPLSIVTIAGLLSKSDMSPVYWESVAQNVIQIVSTGDEDEHCSKILWLSYNNLPMHLKPCFLHFRIFPEDSNIHIRQLKRSWIGEGIIKPILGRRIEDVAMEYLNDLVDRNLIFIRSRNFYGKVKTCGVHDLLRELCLRESKEEDFVQLPRLRYEGTRGRKCFGDLSHGKKDLDVQVIFLDPGSSRPRISMCHECVQKYSYIHRLRFIKNPDSDSHAGDVLPTTLRCIAYFGVLGTREPFHSYFWKSKEPLHSIVFLWNLQILTVFGHGGEELLLSVIWEMPQLRYLVAPFKNLPCPSEEVASVVVLEELQTLRIGTMRLTKEVTKRIPNLKKLEFFDYDEDKYSLENIAFLHQLESLTISGMSCTTYPNSLRKLSLKRCRLCCKDMSVIGSMSNLQVLKLDKCIFEGDEWLPIEGEFPQLKVLDISYSHLRRWEVEEDHCFPRLERLRLSFMKDLKDIPCGIAEISTLISIDVYCCNEWLGASARLICEEQHNLGNESLQFHVEDER